MKENGELCNALLSWLREHIENGDNERNLAMPENQKK